MAEAPQPPSQEFHPVPDKPRVFPPPEEFARRAHLRSMEEYRRLWEQAARAPESYWEARGLEELHWRKPFKTVLQWLPPHARWFEDGRTNLAYNCLDRHLDERRDKTAILFEGEPGDRRTLTYGELAREVNRLANGLRSLGVHEGDRVGIYLPVLSPLPGATPTRPGSATLPLPGIHAEVLDRKGLPVPANQDGLLFITRPWPSMLRTVYRDPERYENTYFGELPGKYFSGERAQRDEDGYIWMLGRGERP